jgi:O-Antigen ligase
MATESKQFTVIDKIYISIILVIFAGIVFHAPLIASVGNILPAYDIYVKSWKEFLMGIAAILAVYIMLRKKQTNILRRPILIILGVYSAVHILLVPVIWQGVMPTIAGLFIDLRYVLFFILVYIAISLYPSAKRYYLITFFAGAFIVCVFALLQVFVLPRDILAYIGYNKNTIIPYLFVDANEDFVRINSTLRGPNPLGAYAGIILSVLPALILKTKILKSRRNSIILAILGVGALVALWFSYSRSALVAAGIALSIVLLTIFARKMSRTIWVVAGVVLLVLGGALFIARDTSFVSNVILHDNATTGAKSNSNEGHIDSLQDGVYRMATQPLGGGIGSTGSASLYGDEPLIIENQYLFIAHEVGWLGLVLFLVLFVMILRQLWHRRADWLALGVFASGIGMALIGILLPVWVDDTVAIIWWGLAAIALATPKTFLTKPR